MLQNLRNYLGLAIATIGVAIAPMVLPASANAQTPLQNGLCSGASNLQISTGASTADCSSDTESTNKVNSTITTAINVFSTIVGVIAVLMIIYGGLRYITSGGDSGKITNAKNTIIYALIGLVVVALAQFIVKFMLSQVTS
jgi:cytochrome bd-type quinol oxidase subunit 2